MEENKMVEEDVVAPIDPEKMKRMSMAMKAVGGWFSVFMGMGALFLGLFTRLGTDIFTIIIGGSITSLGLILLVLHLWQKKPSGRSAILKTTRYLGLLSFILGFWSLVVIDKQASVKIWFNIVLIMGFLFLIATSRLKKKWGIKKI